MYGRRTPSPVNPESGNDSDHQRKRNDSAGSARPRKRLPTAREETNGSNNERDDKQQKANCRSKQCGYKREQAQPVGGTRDHEQNNGQDADEERKPRHLSRPAWTLSYGRVHRNPQACEPRIVVFENAM
jgi:hypothetical protein